MLIQRNVFSDVVESTKSESESESSGSESESESTDFQLKSCRIRV